MNPLHSKIKGFFFSIFIFPVLGICFFASTLFAGVYFDTTKFDPVASSWQAKHDSQDDKNKGQVIDTVLPSTGMAGAQSRRSVRDGKLYVNDKLYAELLFLGRNPLDSKQSLGVAIHYLANDSYVWISPHEGWRLKVGERIITSPPQVILLWGDTLNPEDQPMLGDCKVSKLALGDHLLRSGAHLSDDGLAVQYDEVNPQGIFHRSYWIRWK